MARGEIFFVDLPHQSSGAREQSGRRPVIVVQNVKNLSLGHNGNGERGSVFSLSPLNCNS